MAADRTRPDNPRAELPEETGRVRPLTRDQAGKSLVQRLVPVVDKIRQLNTRFGTRPYRVFLVHIGWSGQVHGIGQAREISRVEILPTPRISSMEETTNVLGQFGLNEDGGLRVSEISGKYSEDDLRGRTPDLSDPVLPKRNRRSAEFFWEVVQQDAHGGPAQRRRYVPSAVPDFRADRCAWSVTLTKQNQDRTRASVTLDRQDP